MATIRTHLTVVAENEVDDDEVEALMEENDYDSVEEYVASMADDLEARIATRTFGDADEIPILDVNTEVEK